MKRNYLKHKKPFPESYSGSILYQNFLNKNLEENKELQLGSEIKKKKQEISSMFRNKFGRNFLNVKPDSLIIFQKLFGQYLFEPESQFLTHFPKLRKKLMQEKKITEFKLKEKIDMGALVYFDLKNKEKKGNRRLEIGKEKMLTFSKNLETKESKDVVQSEFYQIKFWDKNKEKLDKYFKKKFINDINNLIKEENEDRFIQNDENMENELNDGNKEEESDEKSSINNSIVKDLKEKQIQNFKLDKSSKISSDKTLDDFIKTERKISDIKKKYEGRGEDKEKFLNKTVNINKKNIILSCKYGNGIRKLIETKNKTRNINNFSGLFANSNTFRNVSNNVSNSKINESNNSNSNFLNKATNFNLSNSKGFTTRNTIFKTYFPSKFSQKKKVTSLKKKQYKFKYKLDNRITKLNQYTNKCNTKLIKLIDKNNDDNYQERKKIHLKKNQLDIKEDLIEKKEIKKNEFDDEMIPKEKEKGGQTEEIIEGEKDTVLSLLEGARKDTNDKFGGKVVPQNREKIFKKKLIHIPDDQALGMVEDFLEKKKELIDIRKVLETDSLLEKKKIREMKYIRLKTKNNYNKMLRLKNQIIQDKGKILKELEKYDIN